jgi:hypothetical protein
MLVSHPFARMPNYEGRWRRTHRLSPVARSPKPATQLTGGGHQQREHHAGVHVLATQIRHRRDDQRGAGRLSERAKQVRTHARDIAHIVSHVVCELRHEAAGKGNVQHQKPARKVPNCSRAAERHHATRTFRRDSAA